MEQTSCTSFDCHCDIPRLREQIWYVNSVLQVCSSSIWLMDTGGIVFKVAWKCLRRNFNYMHLICQMYFVAQESHLANLGFHDSVLAYTCHNIRDLEENSYWNTTYTWSWKAAYTPKNSDVWNHAHTGFYAHFLSTSQLSTHAWAPHSTFCSPPNYTNFNTRIRATPLYTFRRNGKRKQQVGKKGNFSQCGVEVLTSNVEFRKKWSVWCQEEDTVWTDNCLCCGQRCSYRSVAGILGSLWLCTRSQWR